MKRSTIIACLLLALIAVLHVVRLAFGVSLQIAGDEVPLLTSVVAIVIFGSAAVYLWKDASRT